MADFCGFMSSESAGNQNCKARDAAVMLYVGNREPPLDQLLDDPIVQLVMARDGLPPEEVGAHIEAARRRLREQRRSTDARAHIAPMSSKPRSTRRRASARSMRCAVRSMSYRSSAC